MNSDLKPVFIEAVTLDDAWHQCMFKILEPGVAVKRIVDQGSYEGEYRLEFDYITVHIVRPGDEPRIPSIPPQIQLPNPANEEYVASYFERYLMSGRKEKNEQYTYGERIIFGDLRPIYHIGKEHTHLREDRESDSVNQRDEIIKRYKENGYGNNQLIIQVGQPADIALKDPPCLRHIDTRIKNGKLHFFVYFRSWDLWSGFPANLAGIQMLKEYMAGEIGVEDGEMICSSKGLHLYGYTWEIAGRRRGLTEKEINLFLKEIKREA